MQTNNFKTLTNASEFTTKAIGGRNYLIVPAVPVKEQVMNHYLVPAKELEFAQMWNGIPITIRHPVRNNGSANVPEPDVAVIGKFYNGQWDAEEKRVVGEYWIDVDEAIKYVEGQYILNAVHLGQVLETSTGYWADEELASGEFGGRAYETIHRNLRPDHIAILVDATGACSVADGCGVNRNSLVHQLWVNECLYQQGGPGSGDFSHGGRPGQVGGSSPRSKITQPKERTKGKELKKQLKAYYVTPKDKASKYSKGYSGRVSLMSRAKAETLFESMTRGGFDPVAYEVSLRTGTPYISLTSSSITVSSIPGSAIKEISIDELKSRPGGPFKNNFMLETDCGCPDMVQNEASSESMTDKIEGIRSAFYKEFMQPQEMPYIKDIFDDHCLVEYGDEVYNAYFSTGEGGEIKFDPRDKWKKMELVETADTGEDNSDVQTNVVGGNAPAEVKRIFERVYTDTLKKVKDKAKAAKIAWGAVHRAGWMQDKEGKWMKAKKKGEMLPANKSVGMLSNNKETTMKKLSLNSVLELLKGKGVDVQVNNQEELDENLELEMEETVEQQAQAPVAEPTFSADEVKALKALAATDFTKLNAVIDKIPAVVEMAQNAEAEKSAKKAELVGVILNTSGNVFSKEELDGMSLPMLTKVNSQLSFSYAGLAGAPTYTNQSDDEAVGLPNISFEKE